MELLSLPKSGAGFWQQWQEMGLLGRLIPADESELKTTSNATNLFFTV